MARVDAHHHLWDDPTARQWIQSGSAIDRGFTLDDLRGPVGEADIDATIAVQTVHSADETRDLLALADRESVLAGVVGWTDLEAPNAAGRIAELQSGPGGGRLVGIRHIVQAEADRNWLDRPAARSGIAAVGAAGLAYDLLVLPDQLDATVRLVRDLPHVTFVLDHLAKPPYRGDLAPWATGIRALAASPNVSCKVSGLVTEVDWATCTAADLQPAVDVVRDAFGPHRLLFGSDWPMCVTQTTYAEVVTLAETLLGGSSKAELDAFFGDNAVRLYRLGTHRD